MRNLTQNEKYSIYNVYHDYSSKYVKGRYWKIVDETVAYDMNKEKEKEEEGELSLMLKSEFVDFRCVWREAGLFGIKSFGLVIRYFVLYCPWL